MVEYVGRFNHAGLHESLGDRPAAELEALAAEQSEALTSIIMNKEPS